MSHNLATAESQGHAEITPGPLYPDRCLECPELLVETYGGIRHSRCVDCLAASRAMRNRAATMRAEERSVE